MLGDDDIRSPLRILSPLKRRTDSQARRLRRGGVYGPFLSLAEACELHNGHVGQIAESLLVDAHKVNEAHLQAISWAQNLSL